MNAAILQGVGSFENPTIKLIVLEDIQEIPKEGDKPNFKFLNNNVQCDLCGHVVKNSQELIVHWKLEMTKKKMIKSQEFSDSEIASTIKEETIKKEYSDTSRIPESLLKPQKHGEGKVYKCKYENCDYDTIHNSLLGRHVKHVHELIRYDCAFCDRKGIGRDGLRKHFINKHKEHNFVLKEHKISQVVVTETKEFLCNYSNCGFKASNMGLLTRHYRDIHEGVKCDRPFRCEICQKNFPKSWKLKEHIVKVHEKERNRTFLCDMCDKAYIAKYALEEHMAAKHDVNAIYYNCEKCDYKTVRKGNLGNHMKYKHTDLRDNQIDETFFCEYCAFSTRYKQTLKAHVDSKHFGVKFNCNQCDSVFSTKQALDQHVNKLHLGVSYKCDQCDYDAYNPAGLTEHKKVIHEGKRYKCDSCEYETTTRGVLHAHKKAKHENMRYNCTHCQYSASFMTNLRKHMKTSHPNEIQSALN